jgi:hypothetical protein
VREMKKELLIGICLLTAIIAGCLSNPATSNSSAGVQEVSISQTTAIPPTQNQTKITPVTVVTTVTPHFTRTISIGANKLTFGSNLSPPITEDQAWKHAEQYLAKYGMQGFNQAEIIPLGQRKFTYENGTQTWTWGFHVKRCSEEGRCYGLAIVTIDANDGHLTDIGVLD